VLSIDINKVHYINILKVRYIDVIKVHCIDILRDALVYLGALMYSN